MSRPLRIVIADPQPLMRTSVRRALEQGDFVVCAEAGDADRAVAAVERERPDVCLLEVVLPGGGIRACGEIESRVPETAIVMLTSSADVDDLFDSIRAGAIGYLLKDMDPESLPRAICGVLDGEAAIPRGLVAALVRELHSRGHKRALVGRNGPVELTQREWGVLELLAAGLSTAQSAERLFLSPVTIRRHISMVVGKLGVADRNEAVKLLADAEGRSRGEAANRS